MSSSDQMTDDDESFDQIDLSNVQEQAKLQGNIEDIVTISSDEDTIPYACISSDEEELPEVNIKQRLSVIKNLFPTKPDRSTVKSKFSEIPSSSRGIGRVPTCPKPVSEAPKVPGFMKTIGGVKVHLPVEPYGCQVVLMFKLITAIKNEQNCLLESPTGSGKTLALLCGALAWQQHSRDELSRTQAQNVLRSHPELSRYDGAVDYVTSPLKTGPAENPFMKTQAEKSIYDKPAQNGDGASSSKRIEPMDFNYSDEAQTDGEVTIHKKRRIGSPNQYSSTPGSSGASPSVSKNASPEQYTPEKTTDAKAETPENIRTPTIFYGARTHKQLQQVIKEFRRTSYCGQAKMTILSSREHSCIREFDRSQWPTKNDMCRGCTKKQLTESQKSAEKKRKSETNCDLFDNSKALNHEELPPAFDLEDLVAAGHEKKACPYYAARTMAQTAEIVFCPYNYLIEPGIRSSMQIYLEDNIVIIDEAHNIEDICRDAATFTITEESVRECALELETCTTYRFANQDCLHYLDFLLATLRKWEQWFRNQLPLVNNKVNNKPNNEAVHTWQETDHFIQTLNNHSIGQPQYDEFNKAATIFIQKLRDGTATLYGVTQMTGSLVEAINTVLGYLFKYDGKYKSDFKPLLIRTVQGNSDSFRGWTNSQYNNWVEKESLSLRLLCLNSAVVFSQLKSARCIILASGTLTPLVSLHSELDTEFPLQISPPHVIPADRVWIGTLTTCPNGHPLKCTSSETDVVSVQDGLGEAVRWVCQVTPNGVLCFLPSYALMNKLHRRWEESGMWRKLNQLKHVFMESRNSRDHNEVMEDFYSCVSTSKGALLFAVYRGKVSEGMDFKDHQARAVVTIGVPFPNTFDVAVKEKMSYNDKFCQQKKLLSSREWLRVQAYRALNQAVGRCVRHRADWGAVLLIDARFQQPYYTEHLSKWVRKFLGDSHHTFESLVNSANGLETFMQSMNIRDNEDEH